MVRILSGINKSVSKRKRQIFRSRKILVITLLLAGQRHAKRVVKIIVPFRIKSPSALLQAVDDLAVVAITLSDDLHLAVQFFRAFAWQAAASS